MRLGGNAEGQRLWFWCLTPLTWKKSQRPCARRRHSSSAVAQSRSWSVITHWRSSTVADSLLFHLFFVYRRFHMPSLMLKSIHIRHSHKHCSKLLRVQTTATPCLQACRDSTCFISKKFKTFWHMSSPTSESSITSHEHSRSYAGYQYYQE